MNDKEFPRDESEGSGGCDAYSVEARHSFREPLNINGQWFHKDWKRVRFDKVPEGFGVPNKLHAHEAESHGLLTWQTANAMRWWLHASSDAICLDTRIVRHRVEWSHKIVAVSAHHTVGGEDRSSIMPDWNVPGGSVKRD